MILFVHLLHGWICFWSRTVGPQRALRMARDARFVTLDDAHARHLLATLEPWGTCLTRALTIAALTPRAQVALGGVKVGDTFQAHAWVEIDGVPLRAQDPFGQRLAALD